MLEFLHDNILVYYFNLMDYNKREMIMCSKETINEALEGIDITKKAILFLDNEREINNIFLKIRNIIIEKDDFYVTQLKENIDKFEQSILGKKGHIRYISKRLIHPKKVSFQAYNEDANELKKLKKAYCTFYSELSKYINTNANEHSTVKDVLIESFKAFEKMYCPQVKISSKS
jgi:hypothetical protein